MYRQKYRRFQQIEKGVKNAISANHRHFLTSVVGESTASIEDRSNGEAVTVNDIQKSFDVIVGVEVKG